MERFSLPGDVVDELCARLGVRLPTDLDGVAALYRAWCEQIPFDSISKALARTEGSLPPGGDPLDLAQRWLTTTLGGTCWGHTSTMAAVLEHAGVRCQVGLDRFQVDHLVDLHSFLVVADGDRTLALDVVHHSGEPIELRDGARGTHPAYPVWFVEDEGRLLHHYLRRHRTTTDEVGSYAVLSTDLDAADLRTFCEVMRVYGMRALSLYHRRFTADAMLDASPADDGTALLLRRIDRDGTTSRSIADPDEAFAAMGYTPAAVEVAFRAGLVTRKADGTVAWSVRPPSS